MSSFVRPHDPDWKIAFALEARSIDASFGSHDIILHHVGSTAIEGILAKPIIDMLGIVSDLTVVDFLTPSLTTAGYDSLGENGIAGRRYFRKSNANGDHTHHLHVYAQGSAHIERHLAFRDYLIAHPTIASAYSDLKAALTADAHVSRQSYANGKAPFVDAVEEDAVAWYRRKVS